MSMQGFIQYQATCRKCGGAGTVITDPCGGCQGQGEVKENLTLKVDIPAGVEDSMELRVPGKGQSGRGGPAGNMYISIRVQRSRHFERDGADVYSTVDISLAQAVLGGRVPVKGIWGEMNLKIPSGTESGRKARLNSRGMPVVNASKRGDHYVEYKIKVPKEPTRVQRELLLRLAYEEDQCDTTPFEGTVEGLEEFTKKLDEMSSDEPASQGEEDTGLFGTFSGLFGSKDEGEGSKSDPKGGSEEPKEGGGDTDNDDRQDHKREATK